MYTNRSSHRRCSVRKGVLRNFTIITGKHLRESLFFNKVAGWPVESLAQVFYCEFLEISKSTFFTEHFPATASMSSCFLGEVKGRSSNLSALRKILFASNQFSTFFRSWMTCFLTVKGLGSHKPHLSWKPHWNFSSHSKDMKIFELTPSPPLTFLPSILEKATFKNASLIRVNGLYTTIKV